MTKRFSAFLAASLTTACIAIFVLAVGGAALLNPNGTVAAQSASQAAAALNGTDGSQVQQLQALVAQYQSREQQYQAREQQYQQQLQSANGQVQQARNQIREVRALLSELQQRGLITITADGQIVINR